MCYFGKYLTHRAVLGNVLICAINAFTNVALNKPTSQSSQLDEWGASSNAVDGVSLSRYWDVFCSSTDKETLPWWQVDLRFVYVVERLVVQNRYAFGERLRDVYVLVGMDGQSTWNVCTYFPGPGLNDRLYDWPCNQPLTGRFVRLIIMNSANDSMLTLCEVEINGTRVDPHTAGLFARDPEVMTSSTVTTLPVATEMQCASACVSTTGCKAFNLKTTGNQMSCDLLLQPVSVDVSPSPDVVSYYLEN